MDSTVTLIKEINTQPKTSQFYNINKVYKVRRNSDSALGYFKYSIGGTDFTGESFGSYQAMELLYTELGKLFNVKVVETSIEYLDGIKGLFTKLHCEENEFVDLHTYTGKDNMETEDIMSTIAKLRKKNPQIISDMIDVAILDTICLQGDRNTSNLALIQTNGRLELYPVYDNEICLISAFNHINNIEDILDVADVGLQMQNHFGNYFNLIAIMYSLTNLEEDMNHFEHCKFNFNVKLSDIKKVLKNVEEYISERERKLILKTFRTQLDFMKRICTDSRIGM